MGRDAKYKEIPSNITQIAEQITEIVEDGAIARSGVRIGSIDTIIFATGYNIKVRNLSICNFFKFLKKKWKKKTIENAVQLAFFLVDFDKLLKKW